MPSEMKPPSMHSHVSYMQTPNAPVSRDLSPNSIRVKDRSKSPTTDKNSMVASMVNPKTGPFLNTQSFENVSSNMKSDDVCLLPIDFENGRIDLDPDLANTLYLT